MSVSVWHSSPRDPSHAAFAAASDAAIAAQHARGVRDIELSWVLEDNEDLIGLTRLQNCERYKTYRIYERRLEGL